MIRRLIILLLIVGCAEDNKWKGVGEFEITRQKSFNYSEMISGELDSTTKNELEKFKQHSIKNNGELEKPSVKKTLKQIAQKYIKIIKNYIRIFFDSRNININ